MGSYEKDPNADLDYGFNWSDWLGTDTIDTSTWVLAPDAAPTLLHLSTHDTTTTTVWVDKGLTAGQVLRLTNHVVTAAGREDERSHTITLKDR